jgi:hypothetical protein
MKRWHEELHIARREWRKHRKSHVDSNKNARIGYSRFDTPPGTDPYEVKCDCDEQIGRFRKKDAWDCGNTKCFVCHSDKFPKRELTSQEIASKLSFDEQMKEL